MELKGIFYIMVLSIGGITKAQVSRESYNKAVDLLNCKTVEITLPTRIIQQYQEQCPCGATVYLKLNQFLVSEGNLDATIALSNEIESLKKAFKQNWKSQDVIAFLSESVFTDTKYKKIMAFADKRKGKTEFEQFSTRLNKELSILLVGSVSQNNKEMVTHSNNEQRKSEDANTEVEIDNNNVEHFSILGATRDYLTLLSLLLSGLALILIFRKQNGKDSEVSEAIQYYVNSRIDDANFNKSSPSNDINTAELRDANNKIRELELQIEKINRQFTIPIPIPAAQPSTEEVKKEIFYLSTPNAEGSFNESSASSVYKEGATIYRFTRVSNNRAKFGIDEKDASAILALQFPDKNIDPVCDAMNAFNPKATRIATVELGEAELQNGKWIVDKNKKAKIRYEG